jgi:hypothetical protein
MCAQQPTAAVIIYHFFIMADSNEASNEAPNTTTRLTTPPSPGTPGMLLLHLLLKEYLACNGQGCTASFDNTKIGGASAHHTGDWSAWLRCNWCFYMLCSCFVISCVLYIDELPKHQYSSSTSLAHIHDVYMLILQFPSFHPTRFWPNTT